MSTLSVLKFPNPNGAQEALKILQDLQKQELIHVDDAAIVRWDADKKKPKTQHGSSLVGLGALDGAFWGLLFGFLFFMPLLGTVIGAATGALAGSLTHVGIDPDFIKKVQTQVTPGTSALFLLSDSEVPDRIVPELKSLQPTLITTNLPTEQEAKLRELFHNK